MGLQYSRTGNTKYRLAKKRRPLDWNIDVSESGHLMAASDRSDDGICEDDVRYEIRKVSPNLWQATIDGRGLVNGSLTECVYGCESNEKSWRLEVDAKIVGRQ